MSNQVILHQTPLSELAALICNAVGDKLKELQLPQPKQEPKFYTREETAQILGVSLPTLYNWTMTGKIQGTRIGTRVRYRMADIDAALKDIHNVKCKRR